MKTLIAALCLALSLASCASRPATRCFSFSVIVTALDDAGRRVAPGMPVPITVRSTTGRVLTRAMTGSEGNAALQACWQPSDPPLQIEAALQYGPQFVGTFASFANQTNTYCLTLPTRFGGHCGEWGTGPKLPDRK